MGILSRGTPQAELYHCLLGQPGVQFGRVVGWSGETAEGGRQRDLLDRIVAGVGNIDVAAAVQGHARGRAQPVRCDRGDRVGRGARAGRDQDNGGYGEDEDKRRLQLSSETQPIDKRWSFGRIHTRLVALVQVARIGMRLYVGLPLPVARKPIHLLQKTVANGVPLLKRGDTIITPSRERTTRRIRPRWSVDQKRWRNACQKVTEFACSLYSDRGAGHRTPASGAGAWTPFHQSAGPVS